MRNQPLAFTLIELLVVITIIVVLLAILTPAMDKAVYQAELVVCGGKLKAVAAAVTAYAFDHRRFYPFRDLPPTETGAGNPQYVAPMELVRPVNTFDMRPFIRGFLDINKMLQCPMTDTTLVLDPTPVDEWVFASYAMWWGWLYRPSATERHAGLFRIGDRFEWDGMAYDTLAGDWDLNAQAGGAQGSHPDELALMSPLTHRRTPVFEVPQTCSLWLTSGALNRGLMEQNHAFTDGSVRRYDGVKPHLSDSSHDERMGAVPASWQNVEPLKRHQIPKP